MDDNPRGLGGTREFPLGLAAAARNSENRRTAHGSKAARRSRFETRKGDTLLKLITTLDSLSKSLLRVALVAIVGFGGWLGYSYHSGRRESAELTQQLDARQHEILALTEAAKVKDREIQRLQVANRLLKVDRRVARINVVSQTGSAKAGDLATKFTFEEVDAENKPLDQPRTFTVRGDVIYLDAWVIKYKDDFVESGDPLHSMSVCLYRRIFGESQEPKDGFVLDPVGASPAAYRTGRTMTDSEREIWSKFWEYANNPPLAGQAGIRAAHGEAPSIKLMPGRRYRISLRASAGLEIAADDATGRQPG